MYQKYGHPDLLVNVTEDMFGPPTIERGDYLQSLFTGRKGIIIFHVNFLHATGHADLWNGSSCALQCYFESSHAIRFYGTSPE